MPARPRPDIAALSLPPHGAVHQHELQRRGINRAVIDFSASLNPLGAPPAVAAAMSMANVAPYPDPSAQQLRRTLAESLGLDPQQLLVGNGSSELIWLIALAYLSPGDSAAIIGPTFGEYARACRIAGAEVTELRAQERDTFQLKPEALHEALARQTPRLIFLCNPNNPTGVYLSRAEVLAIADAGAALLVVDEAYLPFVADAESLVEQAGAGRLLLLRSLTKAYALAGLRLGYAIGDLEAIDALRKVQPPWSTNSIAQQAGAVALADPAHLERARAVIEQSKRYLYAALHALDLHTQPSAANFLLVRVGDAATVRRRLLEQGIAVRDCSSFGLPAHIRIGVRAIEECEQLIRALATIMRS